MFEVPSRSAGSRRDLENRFRGQFRSQTIALSAPFQANIRLIVLRAGHRGEPESTAYRELPPGHIEAMNHDTSSVSPADVAAWCCFSFGGARPSVSPAPRQHRQCFVRRVRALRCSVAVLGSTPGGTNLPGPDLVEVGPTLAPNGQSCSMFFGLVPSLVEMRKFVVDSGPNVVDSVPVLVDFGRHGAELRLIRLEFGQTLFDVDHYSGAILAEFARVRASIGRHRSRFGRIRATLPRFCANLWSIPGRFRPTLAEFGSTSVGFRADGGTSPLRS